jgi:DNA-directed RNA polymerase I subunit RPA2
MGTPCHSIRNRADNKLYRLNFPQSPIVKTKLYDHYRLDDYPLGTNAIVAVVSYSGYDMEDAMVLNKSSFERGFGHGMVFSTEIVELNDRGASRSNRMFKIDPSVAKLSEKLDSDGLPYIGSVVQPGDPFYWYFIGNLNI